VRGAVKTNKKKKKLLVVAPGMCDETNLASHVNKNKQNSHKKGKKKKRPKKKSDE
jgi:hypothetical protein